MTPAAAAALAHMGASLPGLPALESLAIRREYDTVVPLATRTERALCRLLGKAAESLAAGRHPLRCGTSKLSALLSLTRARGDVYGPCTVPPAGRVFLRSTRCVTCWPRS